MINKAKANDLAPRKPLISLAVVLPEDESLSPRTDPPRIRQNGGLLEGYLDFSAHERTDFQATIRFEGISRTWIWQGITDPDNGHIVTGEHKFLSQDQSVASGECEPEIRLERYYYKVPFKFIIPEMLPLSSRNPFVKLPPSYKGGFSCENTDGESFMQPLIGYTIRAVVVLKDARSRLISCERGRASRDILLWPVEFAPPPTEVADLEGDYQPSTKSSMKRSFFGKNIGDLQVSAVEPPPLNMATDAPRSTSVVPLKLSFIPPGVCGSKGYPFKWEFRIETKILKWTFHSTRPMEREPSLQDLQTKPFMDVVSSVTDPETRIINDASWSLSQLPEHGQVLPWPSPHWITSFSVPINAPKDLIPSFLTPLASRRYALKISVHVVGLHHQALELQVPLQVYLEPSKSDGGRLSCNGANDRILSDQGDIAKLTFVSDGNTILTPVAPIVKNPPNPPSYKSCTDCTRALRTL